MNTRGPNEDRQVRRTAAGFNHTLRLTRPSRYCCNRCVPWAGSLNLGRYMRVARILFLSLLVMLSACSTNQQGLVSRSEVVGPAGTFVGPADNPVMKVHLEQSGIYVVEDIGPSEFWTMMEGTKAYPQRMKFPPQRGRWSLDSRTGQLALKPATSGSFRWSTAHFRYDKSHPDQLAWGDYAFLSRANE